MTSTVAIIGAGGKIGSRLTDNLRKEPYQLLFSEKGARGIAALEARGLIVTPPEEAAAQADLILLAVPDALMRIVTAELVPLVRPGATVILLDPAAAAAKEVTLRDDVNFVVCHPCHPPLFGEQPGATPDYFGGVSAPQDIVIALLQGDESAFAAANALCTAMFAPVKVAHRITVEQMALLEPAMAEVVAASAIVLMREALDETVRRGVPYEAAKAFMLGHVQVPLAILFDVLDAQFSDACKIAIRKGTEMVIKPDWRRAFDDKELQDVIHHMLHPEEA